IRCYVANTVVDHWINPWRCDTLGGHQTRKKRDGRKNKNESCHRRTEYLRIVARLLAGVFRLLDKTKVKAKPEQDEMKDGAPLADFRRHDKIGAQQRHRYPGKVEIELNPCADKECTCQEFAKLPAAPCRIKCRQTEDDQCDEKCDDHVHLRFTAR